jgi:hypothetical protein
LSADAAALRDQLSEWTRAKPGEGATRQPEIIEPPAVIRSLDESEGITRQLAGARREGEVLEARVRELQEQLQAAVAELEALQVRAEEAAASRDHMAIRFEESEQAFLRVSTELQMIQQRRSQDAVTIAMQERRLRELSEQLVTLKEEQERERTLLAASRDIHDLMGARNLHIVDVLDVDSKGKDQRAFGRVFYTEGKSLVFYAFDLGNRDADRRNASFQVWGSREAAPGPTQNLGIFFVDDQTQNRWVLKFDDPQVLAQIDSVFVTVEPHGGSAKPTGRKFLYAYLNADPNHP